RHHLRSENYRLLRERSFKDMECGYGCLSNSGHPLPQCRSARVKLTMPPIGMPAMDFLGASGTGWWDLLRPAPYCSHGAGGLD
ncbi:MAG: hypothetical protein KAJ42_13510, partial [Gemmatimonadetes bacterium]|nr:hypothetical protein [Gemmatimonadota bacterium]